MRFPWSVSLGLILVATAALAAAGKPETARKAFSEGQALLKQGDFDGALSAFKTAARGERSNEAYGQQYAMLRQIVQLRKKLPNERDGERWLSSAAALHVFYHENGLLGEALPLDRERLSRAPSAESAVLLAKTQLALGMNSEAASMLEGLSPDSRSPHTAVLRALALARMGQLDRARALVPVGEQSDIQAPEYFIDLARVQVALGQPQDALRALKRSIELMPPSRMEDHKALLNRSVDFASLAGTADFAEVMKTASTIQESPCSGGSGCSKCPKRAKCAGEQSAEKAGKH